MGIRARLKGQRAREREYNFDEAFTGAEKRLLQDYLDWHDETYGKPEDEDDPTRKNFYRDASEVLNEQFAEMFTLEKKFQTVRSGKP